MAHYSDEYQEAFEKELSQFLFLSNKNDAKMLISKYKKKNLNEFVRLACIAMVFDYKRIFLKITAIVEKDLKEFLNRIDSLNGNFALFESWITGFIDKIKDNDAQKIAREYWEEFKIQLDKDNFNVRQIV